MCPNSKKSMFVALVLISALIGCAGGGRVQSTAPMSGGGNIIAVEAGSYKFTPNEIRLDKPGLLAIEIKNVSGSAHNFTLEDLHGKILKNVDLKPKGSMIVNVELTEPGVYKFHCNKLLHSSMGMNGKIIVSR